MIYILPLNCLRKKWHDLTYCMHSDCSTQIPAMSLSQTSQQN